MEKKVNAEYTLTQEEISVAIGDFVRKESPHLPITKYRVDYEIYFDVESEETELTGATLTAREE